MKRLILLFVLMVAGTTAASAQDQPIIPERETVVVDNFTAVPNMTLGDYSETEDFENEVKWLMDDKSVREDAKRELEEAKEVSEQWNGLEGEKLEEALDYFAEYVILERLKSKSLRDSTALLYRIREIGEEFRSRKFVRPDRSDYSEF